MTKRKPLFLLTFLELFGSTCGICSPSPTCTGENPSSSKQPWGRATIDYSAANEFIAAHYGSLTSHGQPSYFAQDKKEEPIYDARSLGSFSLQSHGISLVPNYTHEQTESVDWNDLESIRNNFLPTVETILQRTYKNSRVIFWCPTRRAKDSEQSMRRHSLLQHHPPTAGFVSTAHIDTDFNAYQSIEEVARLIETNRFPGTEANAIEIASSIKAGNRFVVVNAWVNVATKPIQQAPLALRPMIYTNPTRAFPSALPDWSKSLWYTFPSITNEELLLFCQYDRNSCFPSDVWHCALMTGMENNNEPRESFDVRCFILIDEVVSEEYDRLASSIPSSLTQGESKLFCEKQAWQRKTSASDSNTM